MLCMLDRLHMKPWYRKENLIKGNSTLSAIKYSFDLQMFLRNAREEHIEAYKDAVKAARDFLDGVAILAQGETAPISVLRQSDKRNSTRGRDNYQKELS